MSTHAPPPRHREWKIGCKVYIGNLAEGASKADIETAFSKYGPLRNVWVARNPPGFAFVEFEDGRDAEDACRALDGTRIAGGRIKAEMSHGRSRRGRAPPGYRGGPPPYGGSPMGPAGYGGAPPRGGPYYGGAGAGGRGQYNGGDYPYGGHYGAGGGGGGPRSGSGGYPPSERPPRGERHAARPRSPAAMKDFHRYSRSRSNSLARSPPPQGAPPRTARPKTPPSRSVSPEREGPIHAHAR